MKLWRFGHLTEISVKKGQQVKKGERIAKMGGTGGWLAHLHLDCFNYQPASWTEYVIGKSKEWVEEHYHNPGPYISPTLPTIFDHQGYGWLELADYSGKKAYHPGIDINGPGGGNADLGQKIYAHVDGVIEYIYDGTDNNSGWGKIIILKQEEAENILEGIDISHWNKITDWDKIKKDFIICKCTQGTSYLDPTYKNNIKEIKKRGILCGAYHFADGGDAKKEAEWFLKNVGEVDFIVLDWEIEHADPVGWCKKFIEKTGECYLYTNDARATKYSWPSDWKFWIARYGVNDGTKSKEPAFKNWNIWQYTSKGKVDGIEGDVDLNTANIIIINEDMECQKQLQELQTEYDLLSARADSLSKELEDYKNLARKQDETIITMRETIDDLEKNFETPKYQFNLLGLTIKIY